MFLRTLKSKKDHSHTMGIKPLFLTSRGTKAAGASALRLHSAQFSCLFQMLASFSFPNENTVLQTAVSLCAQHLAQCVARRTRAILRSMKGKKTAMETQINATGIQRRERLLPTRVAGMALRDGQNFISHF